MTQTIGGKQYQDLEVHCKDCDSMFLFTVGEQAFFDDKGFTPPKRCQECRKKKRKDKRRDRGIPRGPRR